MSFTGKSTYTAGATLPEIAEDVSDLVAINSPHETPLLDALGDAARPRSTVHEWLEDALLPNASAIDDTVYTDPTIDESFAVDDAARFRVGDQIQVRGSDEVMFVREVDSGGNLLTVTRGYGGSTPEALANNQTLLILGNAALEGDAAGNARFTARSRKSNFTQIFSASVEVSGSELAVRQLGVADELDYQKAARTRELLRDLENTIINGRAAASNPQGSSTVRRTMNGILAHVASNRFVVGEDGFPNDVHLTEEQLNTALREIWNSSSGRVDLIVVGGREERSINNFVATNRRFDSSDETFKNAISVYESDFGVCRVVMSRWIPTGAVLLLDSSRIEVMPLAGRSFYYKPLATTGDREGGQLIGEYTLEFRNENAHGVISGFNS